MQHAAWLLHKGDLLLRCETTAILHNVQICLLLLLKHFHNSLKCCSFLSPLPPYKWVGELQELQYSYLHKREMFPLRGREPTSHYESNIVVALKHIK